MSRRNFILLIIILALALVAVLGFFYFRKPATNTTTNNNPGTNFISTFPPGSTTTPPVVTPPANVSGEPTPPGGEVVKLKLQKVSSMPVAGFGLFSKERLKVIPVVAPTTTTDTTTAPKPAAKPLTEFVGAVRYADQATGNVYETFADNIQEQKFSQTIIPKVYDAYFGNNGQSVIMRYLKADEQTIETFVGTLPKEIFGAVVDGSNEIKGSFLPDNIKDINMSSDLSKMFYLFSSGNNLTDSMAGITLDLVTNKKIQVFSSPFTDWTAQWPNTKMITLTTKPSGSVPGYMYALNSSGGNLSEILGGINGLTTLSSTNGKLILYSDNGLAMSIYHTDTRVSDPIGIKTLPEKCVWGSGNNVIYCAVPRSVPFGTYPDTWYQGEVSFSDQIWKIDVANKDTPTMIGDPLTTTPGQDIDGIKLALDAGENYLFFVNKKDNFLWELQLK